MNYQRLSENYTTKRGNGIGSTIKQKQAELYQAYEMIQYDIVSGEKYSLQTNFFEK